MFFRGFLFPPRTLVHPPSGVYLKFLAFGFVLYGIFLLLENRITIRTYTHHLRTSPIPALATPIS